MAEHAIPQDILNYEFKLFAGLTWKQFVYVGIGVTFGVLLIQGSVKGIIPAIIGWPLGILAILAPIALALIKLEDRPLEQWLIDALRLFNTPLLRAWMKTPKTIPLKDALNSKPNIFPEYTYDFLEYEENNTNISNTINVTQKIPDLNAMAQTNTLLLTPDNANLYAVKQVTLPQIKNTIAFLIQTHKPITDVTATLLNSNNQIIRQLKSNQKGIIYFNKPLPNGTYTIKFNHPQLQFPTIQVQMTGITYPLIKITPLNHE